MRRINHRPAPLPPDRKPPVSSERAATSSNSMLSVPNALIASSYAPRSLRVLLALGWYDLQIHRGIARFARTANWSLDTHMIRDGLIMEPLRADGVIALLTPLRPDITRALRRTRLPMVDLSNQAPSVKVPRVLNDNVAIAHMAAEYLIGKAFRHYAAFLHFDSVTDGERCNAFVSFLRSKGHDAVMLDCRHLTRKGGAWHDRVVRWLAQQISTHPKPVAILAPSDHLAPMVFGACRLAGASVPEEVAVLGVNNNEMECDFAPVPLSSVDSDLERKGYEAAQLLSELINRRAVPHEPIMIPPRGVVTRMSTDILAVPHVHVATALRFIWSHFRTPINANNVFAQVPMSRVGLHRAFKQHMKRSVADEIARQRVELAKRLLAESNHKVREIARMCGFENMDTFTRTFARLTNESARSFRRTCRPH